MIAASPRAAAWQGLPPAVLPGCSADTLPSGVVRLPGRRGVCPASTGLCRSAPTLRSGLSVAPVMAPAPRSPDDRFGGAL